MRKLNKKQKEMLKTCKYFKGEEECPYGGNIEFFFRYSLLLQNPKSFWWHVEKQLVEMEWDPASWGIKCIVYKHMEFPISEEECMKSYNTSYLK